MYHVHYSKTIFVSCKSAYKHCSPARQILEYESGPRSVNTVLRIRHIIRVSVLSSNYAGTKKRRCPTGELHCVLFSDWTEHKKKVLNEITLQLDKLTSQCGMVFHNLLTRRDFLTQLIEWPFRFRPCKILNSIGRKYFSLSGNKLKVCKNFYERIKPNSVCS